jgi:hypothetical protein
VPYEFPIPKVNNFKEAVLVDLALAQTAACTCKAYTRKHICLVSHIIS